MSRNRRFAPIAVGSLALSAAGLLFAGGTTADSSRSETLAAANRTVDDAATRGASRTAEADLIAAVTTTTSSTAAPTTTTTTTTTAKPKPKEVGIASYYAQPWAKKGCAHKTLPKGTVLTVTNLATGKSTTCVVNDRGPYIAGRIVDLDTAIFKQLASTSAGVFRASITW